MKKKIKYRKIGPKKKRICEGTCGGVQVGPIPCPEGYDAFLNCGADPPTITCIKEKTAKKGLKRKIK